MRRDHSKLKRDLCPNHIIFGVDAQRYFPFDAFFG
jgi:hypothetical protein